MTTSTSTSSSRFQLKINPGDESTGPVVKVLIASQLFNVPVDIVFNNNNSSNTKVESAAGSATSDSSSTTTGRYTLIVNTSNNNTDDNGVVVLSGDDDDGSIGNAMALAISSSSSAAVSATSSQLSYYQTIEIDEWCEWERTNLVDDEKKITVALQYLNDTLIKNGSSSNNTNCSYHIVGTVMTVADSIILTTIHTLVLKNNTYTLPSAVEFYYNAHRETLIRCETSIKELIDTAIINKKNQSSSTVVDDDFSTETRLLVVVSTIFTNAIQQLFGTTTIQLPEHIVKQCQNMKHGDYQCSAAMPVFASIKNDTTLKQLYTNPPSVGTAIINLIGPNHPILMDLSIQGPGFVLCRIRPSFLQKHVESILYNGQLPVPAIGSNKICVVDFSSPNIAKEMHVGHLRSTIIGECICRILEAAQYKTVHRVNHVGDWGTQFGMLIQYLKEVYPTSTISTGTTTSTTTGQDDGTTTTTGGELPNITDLTGFYKNAKERFDNDPIFKKQSQLNVVNLQSHDPDCIRIWQMLCDISRREFEKVYNRLDVTVYECGESFYNDKIPDVINEFTTAGKITISDDGGAKCVFLGDGFAIPLMLQKSDGGYGYDSTDMAALKYRLQVLKSDRIIIITDFTQADHFKMIFKAGYDIGWLQHGIDQPQLEHIGFGTVQGEDGKRFKTRSGDTVRLVDLLDEAVLRMESLLRERISTQQGKDNTAAETDVATTPVTASTSTTTTTTTSMSDEEIRSVAEAIGYGAVKYFDLRRNPTSNYKFSYDQMLSTVGDTAVYIIYARVRLDSIITKAMNEHSINIEQLVQQLKETTSDNNDNNSLITITEDAERNLAFQLVQFPDVMITTLQDLYPFHICDYLYKLATAASDFVTQCRVLDSNNVPTMNSRLLLCHVTSIAMVQCCNLLGIRHVNRI